MLTNERIAELQKELVLAAVSPNYPLRGRTVPIDMDDLRQLVSAAEDAERMREGYSLAVQCIRFNRLRCGHPLQERAFEIAETILRNILKGEVSESLTAPAAGGGE